MRKFDVDDGFSDLYYVVVGVGVFWFFWLVGFFGSGSYIFFVFLWG